MSYATVPEPELLTVEEYLEREATSDVKHEYVGGRIYAFTGASWAHNRVVSRIMRSLLNAAGDGPCEVFGSDMLLRAASNIFYYSDITVICEPHDEGVRYTRRPCLIVEVLSPSTSGTDLREKLVTYCNLESLEGYLIAAQDAPRIDWHWRDEHREWQQARFEGEGELSLPCVDLTLNVAELYAGMPLGPD